MKAFLIGFLASFIVAAFVEIIKMRRSRFHISARLKSSQSYASYTEGDVRIQVEYKSDAIKTSVVVLHLALVNDGKKDIMFISHFSKGIIIRANEGNKIISASVEQNDVSPSISLNTDGSAELSWDIIKAGEKIDLELVICPETTTERLDALRCFNLLRFELRSDCLEKVYPEREESPEERDLNRRENHLKTMTLLAIMAYAMMCLFTLPLSSQYDVTVNGKVYEDAAVMLSSPIGKYIVVPDKGSATYFDLSDFENAHLSVSIPDKKIQIISSFFEIFSLIMVLGMMVLYIIACIYFRKRRRALAKRLN